MGHYYYKDCLNCKHSFSLPAGEPFDDNTVADYDRLVCTNGTPKIVHEEGSCEWHTDNGDKYE